MRPLLLEACFFEEAVGFDNARAPRVELTGCWVPTLTARQFETRGDLTLDGLMGAQEVALAGARIGGVLALRHARLERRGGVVVDGERLHVTVKMDCSHLEAAGELQLPGANIEGDLIFQGAMLTNENGRVLSGDGLQVDHDMICSAVDEHPFDATGEVRLPGAHIGGDLIFRGSIVKEQGRHGSECGIGYEWTGACLALLTKSSDSRASRSAAGRRSHRRRFDFRRSVVAERGLGGSDR